MPIVPDNIRRNRFFKLPSRLKIVDDNMVSAVRPLLDSVPRGCRMDERSSMVSIDEQMICVADQGIMK